MCVGGDLVCLVCLSAEPVSRVRVELCPEALGLSPPHEVPVITLVWTLCRSSLAEPLKMQRMGDSAEHCFATERNEA